MGILPTSLFEWLTFRGCPLAYQPGRASRKSYRIERWNAADLLARVAVLREKEAEIAARAPLITRRFNPR